MRTGQRLQIARVLQRAGVHRLETDAVDQRGHGLLAALAAARVEHLRGLAIGQRRAIGQHVREQRVERLDHVGTRQRLGDLLGGRCVQAQRQAHSNRP